MHSVLYRVTKRVIENGQTDGMDTKLDVFYAAGKLTDEEYTELTTMLKGSSASESAAESTEAVSGETDTAAETETTEEA